MNQGIVPPPADPLYGRERGNGGAIDSWSGGAWAALRCPWVALAVTGALLLRLYRIGEAPLWFDETITAEWVRLGWTDLLRTVLTDNHPPLYFLLLKAWSSLAGPSAAALRFPSAMFSAFCVPLVAAAAGVAAGRGALRWAAWLAAIAPLLIHHGQEARSYALVGFLASMQFLMVMRFLQHDTARLTFGYALVGALLAWSHYYGAAFVLAQAAVLGLTAAAAWRRWLAPAAAASVAAVAAILPATVLAYHQTGGGYELGILAVAGVLWGLVTEYTLLPSSAELHLHGAIAALRFAPLALVCACGVAVALLWGLQRLDRPARVATLVTIGVMVFGPYAASLIATVGMHPRYALPSLAPFIVILAAAASTRRVWQVQRLVLAAIMVVMVVGSARHLADPAHGREDMQAAGRWIDQHVPPGERILVTSNEMAQLARFHWPQRRLLVHPGERTVVTPANVAGIVAEIPLSPAGRVFYVIGREWVSDPQRVLEMALRRRYRSCGGTDVRGIRILCLRPSDGKPMDAPPQTASSRSAH